MCIRDSGQAVFHQDEVGRLLGDVDGLVHRDAHVSGVERWGVVDAVAQEAHDGTHPLPVSYTHLDVYKRQGTGR